MRRSSLWAAAAAVAWLLWGPALLVAGSGAAAVPATDPSASPAPTAPAWQSFQSGAFSLQWRVDGGDIAFNVTAPASGYVALGFSDFQGAMGPADSYVGWLDPATGAARILDGSNSGNYAFTADVLQPAVAVGGSSVGGLLSIAFRRTVAAPSSVDRAITARAMNLIWALGDTLPTVGADGAVTMQQHSTTGAAAVAFLAAPVVGGSPLAVTPSVSPSPPPQPPSPATAASPAPPSPLPASSICTDSFCLQWQVVGAAIHLTLSAPAAGYVSIGFTESAGSMGPADAYAGWIDASGVVHVVDFSTTADHSINPPDAQQDATRSGASLANGQLNVSFVRLLNTLDPNDHVIGPGATNLVWAFSDQLPSLTAAGFSLSQHSGAARGAVAVAFLAPAVLQPSPAPGDGSEEPGTGNLLWLPVVHLVAFVVSVLLLAGVQHLGGRRFLWADRRPLRPCPPRWVHTLTLDIVPAVCDLTVAEGIVCVLWLAAGFLLLLSPPGDPLGRMCAFTIGSVLLPITKNSLWTPLLGCSFERAIKFHRWAARCLVLLLVAHAVDQVFAVGSGVLTMVTDEFGFGWIFGVCAFAVIAFITILALEPIRRGWYELFYYPHLLGLAAVALAMAHSVAVCYVVTPGLALYVLDKLIIAARLARTHRATVTAVSGGTKIVIEDSVNVRYRPGQFFFLMVPGASWCETHPFSASSASGSGPLTFVAKDMGPNTCTRRLAQLSQKASVPLRLHGPYGALNVPFADCRAAVLVAGGAGVTPMASLAAHLLSSRPEGLQVVFVWVCRTPAMFTDWFPALLQDLLANPAFAVHLYCTEPPGCSDEQASVEIPCSPAGEEESVNLAAPDDPFTPAISYSRPDWGHLLEPHAALGSEVAVLVCGPPAMEAAVQRVARAHGHRFHKETFAL